MAVLINTVSNGTSGFSLAFIACELGQRMTDAFEKIDYGFDKLNWYLLPIELKRMLPNIMVNVQQPVELQCFGSIGCTREVFRKVSIGDK